MKRYIKQLIEDLEDVIRQGITRPYIEIPPEMEDCPELAEFELAPRKPLSDWTGIEVMNFPQPDLLNNNQMKRIYRAMQKVFDEIHIKIKFPSKIPLDFKYEVYLYLWNQPFPCFSRFIFQFKICSHDPEDCPLVGYCKCQVPEDL